VVEERVLAPVVWALAAKAAGSRQEERVRVPGERALWEWASVLASGARALAR
jgi:hypothetical protein